MLTGIVKSNIALWISSLSKVNAKELYESIIKDGANRQWTMHMAEKDIANLSDLSCDFIILKNPQTLFKDLGPYINWKNAI